MIGRIILTVMGMSLMVCTVGLAVAALRYMFGGC